MIRPRTALLLAGFVAILMTLPEARMLLATGLAGGVVIGALLILLRHKIGQGPRRGTPISLFPRPVINLAHYQT